MSYWNLTPFYARQYVGWISPAGTFEMVDSYQHDAWAEAKLTELEVDFDTRPKLHNINVSNSDWLLLLGWIHVAYDLIDDSLLCFARTKPSKAALDGLFDLHLKAVADERKGTDGMAESLLSEWKRLVDGDNL